MQTENAGVFAGEEPEDDRDEDENFLDLPQKAQNTTPLPVQKASLPSSTVFQGEEAEDDEDMENDEQCLCFVVLLLISLFLIRST